MVVTQQTQWAQWIRRKCNLKNAACKDGKKVT